MKVFEYRDYRHYVRSQTEANHRKLDTVWVSEESINAVVSHYGKARSVLCHGTRNGAEQRLFAEAYPEALVLGTEISDTAERFPRTVRWDMQKVREQWVGLFDIVYSNSIDHAIYPQETVMAWLGQLTSEGRLYIDHANGPQSNRCTEMDPLEISDDEMEALIHRCGGDICAVMEGIGAGYVPTRIYAVRCA